MKHCDCDSDCLAAANVWCNKNQSKHSSDTVLWLLWFSLHQMLEYDGCFLGASYYVLAAAEGSTQEVPRKHPGSTHDYLVMAGDLNQLGYFSRKHPWVFPGCFLLWHHQRFIVMYIFCDLHCLWYKNSFVQCNITMTDLYFWTSGPPPIILDR